MISDRTKLHAKNSMIEAFKYIDANNNGYLEKE
jgi:Ca2+-binding EF-hand superfamily protein